MRIGFITIHDTTSYGASLQTYATYRVLTEMGYHVSLIDYSLQYMSPNALYRMKNRLKQYIHNIVTGFSLTRKKRKFKVFRNMYYPNATPHYGSRAEIEANAPDFDVYLCGSDQVWNPEHTKFDTVYFLSFVVNKAAKTLMSYASSIGKDILSETEEAFLREHLKCFDYISVREDSAKKLLEEKFGIQNVEQNIDPTFLLTEDEWRKIAKVSYSLPNDYILFIPMAINPTGEQISNEIKVRTGLPVVVLSGRIKKYSFADRQIADADQAEFLSMVLNADIIVTNSFHGAAFALHFQKKLIMYKHPSRNTRLESLSRLLHCENLIVESLDEYKRVHWDSEWARVAGGVDAILEHERAKAIDYFRRSIGYGA